MSKHHAFSFKNLNATACDECGRVNGELDLAATMARVGYTLVIVATLALTALFAVAV